MLGYTNVAFLITSNVDGSYLLFANQNAILQYLMPLFYYIAISIAN